MTSGCTSIVLIFLKLGLVAVNHELAQVAKVALPPACGAGLGERLTVHYAHKKFLPPVKLHWDLPDKTKLILAQSLHDTHALSQPIGKSTFFSYRARTTAPLMWWLIGEMSLLGLITYQKIPANKLLYDPSGNVAICQCRWSREVVSGMVAPDSRVFVDQHEVSVDPSGHFFCRLQLANQLFLQHRTHLLEIQTSSGNHCVQL